MAAELAAVTAGEKRYLSPSPTTTPIAQRYFHVIRENPACSAARKSGGVDGDRSRAKAVKF
jgi:hypothetical protein